MSLSYALGSALTGLDVASRRAGVVSENVAGAGRPGFGRRTLELRPASPHLPGVRTTVLRQEDAAAVALRRDAESQLGASRDPIAFWRTIEVALGEPGDGSGLSDRLAAFEARLIEASAQPASEARLSAAIDAASHFADGVRATSDAIVTARRQAEGDIVATVDRLNDDLLAIADLNARIASVDAAGAATARLQDQRSLLVDGIAEIVDIRVLPRASGAVALISAGGHVLLDGHAAEIGFDPAVDVTPDRTIGAGLRGLSINGRPLPGDGISGLGDGRLSGLFALRDVEAPRAQGEIDAFAAEVVARFSGPDADPSLAPGMPGLFETDPGPGAAGAFSVRSSVSAEPWRLRDGVAATSADPVAGGEVLARLLTRLSDVSMPVGGTLGNRPRNLSGLASDLTSRASRALGDHQGAATRATALRDAAAAREREGGVDIDEEMRRLIEIEQSYAAAARVVETVGDMMDRLTRI